MSGEVTRSAMGASQVYDIIANASPLETFRVEFKMKDTMSYIELTSSTEFACATISPTTMIMNVKRTTVSKALHARCCTRSTPKVSSRHHGYARATRRSRRRSHP